VRHFWIFAHLLGFVMWFGGGLGAMVIGIASRREPRENLAPAMRLLAALYRALILPGSLVTVVSGLVLTLIIYGGPGGMEVINHWVMTMQAAGLLAALIVLIVMVPTVFRIVRLDPVANAVQFDVLRAKIARFGMTTGVLALIALLGGALSRP